MDTPPCRRFDTSSFDTHILSPAVALGGHFVGDSFNVFHSASGLDELWRAYRTQRGAGMLVCALALTSSADCREKMDKQDGVVSAKKQMKKNLGPDEIKRRREDSDKTDVVVVPKSKPPKKPRHKRVETAEKTQDQNAEEVSMKEPDENKPVVDVVSKSEPPGKPRRKRGETAEKTQDQNAEEVSIKEPDEKLQKTQRRKKRETVTENTEDISINEEADKSNRATTSKRKKNEAKTSKSEKTKKVEEKVPELIQRRLQLCTISRKYVGAHVSIQGGLWNAVLEAGRIGARAFGLFLRSQRTWSSKPLEESAAEKFRRTCKEFGFDPHFILPHSPYLMNLGSPKPDVLQKSREMLIDELRRCHKLGLTLYNIHPGSHVGEMPVNQCLELIADGINNAHSQVPDVTVVLENMSCQGNTVGGRFEELRGIIDLIKDQTRIGVCLDTCHAFAAGHNLSQEKGLKHMLDEFDKIVGISYLRAVHLNDSKGAAPRLLIKGKVGCRLDRHENIGRGHIGVKGFRQVMNEQRFNEIPMILETPYTADFDEIELLYSLSAASGTTKRNTKKASAIITTI
ncbi:PREDICTED: DNA-(apurinic or apyrimidinic site) lyase-like [Nanorana parkeri]|uniref:DNA-(apurinic or apyrimidinic site) lyase-like n=1 Tax=Nanorana parkeri TaxID=125878 RepID=UPI00085409A6|nr:PREDICTED: DNA-(apurinic or apyrimidinic site) lyase-like [Nanorana parkeri]